MSQMKRECGASGAGVRATLALSLHRGWNGSSHFVCNNVAHLLIHLSAESGLSLGARVCARAPEGASEDGRLDRGRVARPTADRGTIRLRRMRQFEVAGDISAAFVPGFTHLPRGILFFLNKLIIYIIIEVIGWLLLCSKG